MNKGKIFLTENGYVVQNSEISIRVRDEDSKLPYVNGSDVQFSITEQNEATILECTTSAEIYNLSVGWICPRCNRVNAPFNRFCDC